MSGRRYRKGKYHSRSYSKPLFDPQRLLYFSTTNQRLGKVIRPKSSAVRRSPTIKKQNIQDVMNDLNETKSFRIAKREYGIPTCLFHQHDEYQSIDFPPNHDDGITLTCVNYPLTSLTKTPQLDKFIKNFQPYTPSICYPINLTQRVSVDLTNKSPGDVLNYNIYIVDATQLEWIAKIPSNEAFEHLADYLLWTVPIELNDVENQEIEFEANFADLRFYTTQPAQEVIGHFLFKIPQIDTAEVQGNTLKLPATDYEFRTNNLSELQATLLNTFVDQQFQNYSIWRYPPPEAEHIRVSLVKNLFETKEQLQAQISSFPVDQIFIFSYCYLNRVSQSEQVMSVQNTLFIEGFEVNPVISAQ